MDMTFVLPRWCKIASVASKETSRYQLDGVAAATVKQGKDHVGILAATDGRMLAAIEVPSVGSLSAPCVMPIGILPRADALHDRERTVIIQDEKRISIQRGQFTVSAEPMTRADFPPIGEALPEVNEAEYVFASYSGKLFAALVAALGQEDRDMPVVIAIHRTEGHRRPMVVHSKVGVGALMPITIGDEAARKSRLKDMTDAVRRWKAMLCEAFAGKRSARG